MARARLLKPGFFKNEDLVALPMATRMLFAGLWTLADREGRIEDRPLRIKMELFPCDDIDVASAISALAEKGFVRSYEVAGKRYLCIPTFLDHQKPHRRELASVIPCPGTCSASNCPLKDRPRTDPGQTQDVLGARTSGESPAVTGLSGNGSIEVLAETEGGVGGTKPAQKPEAEIVKGTLSKASPRQKALALLEDREFTEGLRNRFKLSFEDWEYQAEKWVDHVELKPPKANWKNSLRNWIENAVTNFGGRQNGRTQTHRRGATAGPDWGAEIERVERLAAYNRDG